MNRVATAGMTLLLLTLVGCGDASTLDAGDAGDASSQLDGSTSDAQTSGDGAMCSGAAPDANACIDFCDLYVFGACGSQTQTECRLASGWCGARASVRTDASMDAVWACMVMHVQGSAVDCPAVEACWNAVDACL